MGMDCPLGGAQRNQLEARLYTLLSLRSGLAKYLRAVVSPKGPGEPPAELLKLVGLQSQVCDVWDSLFKQRHTAGCPPSLRLVDIWFPLFVYRFACVEEPTLVSRLACSGSQALQLTFVQCLLPLIL